MTPNPGMLRLRVSLCLLTLLAAHMARGEEWQKITHTVTFARDITQVSLILAREAQIGGGHVWFDSVDVVEVEK